MRDALLRGDRVEIRGFGSFKIKQYEGYVGRNPKTGESVQVKPKKMPFFQGRKGTSGLFERLVIVLTLLEFGVIARGVIGTDGARRSGPVAVVRGFQCTQ